MTKTLPQDIPLLFAQTQTQIILRSYSHWTGKDLLPACADKNQAASLLFFAPFVVVTSNSAADPILNYGNEQGLRLWEMSWQQLTQTPGRHTAEAMHRDERQKFLDTVQKKGFIDNYSGIRISSTGRRFKIERATVWNLIDEDFRPIGQAATFSSWYFL
ncbi:MAG TPA: MEKHLA domain-containing protein [Candidatus Omnitrophota bacterium]|nr:MEKHLA domain-containing protein [Candidatus Omnitrophota bacterium]HRK60936.1 MEKHLA domain-containing protein [Candidatus Omnitrophota bacterium]